MRAVVNPPLPKSAKRIGSGPPSMRSFCSDLNSLVFNLPRGLNPAN